MGLETAAIIALIGAGASTATQIYSAKKQSDAVKKATQAQVAAGEKAENLQKEIWQTTRADLQPWMTRGTQAVNALGDLMGLGAGSGGGAAPTAPTLATTFKPNWSSDPYNPRPTTPGNQDTGRQAQEEWRQQRIDEVRARRGLPPIDPTSMTAQRESGYVQMQAPDGSVETVPAQYVDHFRQRGAQLLG